RVKKLTKEIAKLNGDLEYIWAPVPAGTKLKLNPKESREVEITEETRLGDLAAQHLRRSYRAAELYQLNTSTAKSDALAAAVGPLVGAEGVAEVPRVPKAETLPAEVQLKVPQSPWPSIVGFGLLVVFLFVVGIGLILKPKDT